MENIELRDFFAAHIMNGKFDLYSSSYRKNIAPEGKAEEWIIISSEEATTERIKGAAKMAYRIADALINERNNKTQNHE